MHEVEVVNGALGLLKAPRIATMDDQTELAIIAKLRYAACRDAVLTMHPWNFATSRKLLARSGITPAMDWSYQYPLPTNPYCLLVRVPDPDYVAWEVGFDEVDGRILLSNEETMKIRYTARVPDLNIWNALTVQALTYYLASELAMPITGSADKAQGWLKAYEGQLAQAIVSDSREGSPIVARAPRTLTAIR